MKIIVRNKRCSNMDLRSSLLIMKKDFKVSVRKKEILLPMILLPVVFTILLPVVMMIGIIIAPEEYASSFGDINLLRLILDIPSNYNEYLVAAIMMLKMFLLPIFLFIPGLLPAIISADSFAGEKERKTMESLALLPITKNELIIGKILVSFLPSIIISFLCFVGMGLIVNFMFIPYLEGNILIFTDSSFLLVAFLLSPLIAFLNIQISVIISSRSKDLKSAQSISGSLITPVLGILFVQMFNPAFLSTPIILILSGILVLLCLFFIRVAKKVLNIEKLILMV